MRPGGPALGRPVDEAMSRDRKRQNRSALRSRGIASSMPRCARRRAVALLMAMKMLLVAENDRSGFTPLARLDRDCLRSRRPPR